MEILHDLFLITPGNFTSFLIDLSTCSFINTPIIPAAKEQMQSNPRVVTKAHWLILVMSTLGSTRKSWTRSRKTLKQRQQGRLTENKENLKKLLNAKEEVLEQEVELQRTQRHPIKTCGGKQGSFFRIADKETKEQHIQFELVNTAEEGHNKSSRNAKVPSKFEYAPEYKSSSKYKESLDEEDWECKKCGGNEDCSDEHWM